MKRYLIVLSLTVAVFVFLMSGVASAQIPQSCKSAQGGYCVNLTAAAAIPGFEFLQIPQTGQIGDFLEKAYYFLLVVVGFSAFLAFVVGGSMYLFSAGSEKMTSQGRTWMWNATQGLVIAMVSWLILYTINPALVTKLDLSMPIVGGTINGTKAAIQPPKTYKACQGPNNQCVTVEGDGSDNCQACSCTGMYAQQGSTWCKSPGGSCKLVSISFCKNIKGTATGACQESCQ